MAQAHEWRLMAGPFPERGSYWSGYLAHIYYGCDCGVRTHIPVRVRVPWSAKVSQKAIRENLDILNQVAVQ
jgi:hypothetical protein